VVLADDEDGLADIIGSVQRQSSDPEQAEPGWLALAPGKGPIEINTYEGLRPGTSPRWPRRHRGRQRVARPWAASVLLGTARTWVAGSAPTVTGIYGCAGADFNGDAG
jgi:hypothetical protein